MMSADELSTKVKKHRSENEEDVSKEAYSKEYVISLIHAQAAQHTVDALVIIAKTMEELRLTIALKN